MPFEGDRKVICREALAGITLSGRGPRLAVIILKGSNLRPENRPAEGETPCAAKVQHCTGAPGPDGARPRKFRVLVKLLLFWCIRGREEIQIGHQDFLIRGVDHAK